MGFFDDAISSIGRGLAETAASSLSDATGLDVGGFLKTVFGGEQEKGGEDLSQTLAELPNQYNGAPDQLQILQNGLNQQLQSIGDMGLQLVAVAETLQSIQGQIQNIESLLDQIHQEQLYSEWQLVDTAMTPYVAAIQTSYSTYGIFLKDYADSESSDVATFCNNVVNMNNGPQVGINTISQYMVDQGQQRGALQLWSNMVVPLVSAGLVDYRDAVSQYTQYYQKLAYAQLTGTNLLMEAWNFLGESDQAKAAWQTYRSLLLSQEDTFIQWLVPLVYAGCARSSGANSDLVQAHAALQLDPCAQRLRGLASSNPSATYYQPSTVFQNAESVLASLYVTEPSDRRIVVHMLYLNAPELTGLLDGVSLTLSPTGGADPVNATRALVLNSFVPPFGPPSTMEDPNLWVDTPPLNASGFCIKRFTFSASDSDALLADGTYTITNINGTNGLVPIETYISDGGWVPGNYPNPNFMNDAVLGHPISVNAAKPFDFMNFMAYVTPC
jgi:hypothetical protein